MLRRIEKGGVFMKKKTISLILALILLLSLYTTDMLMNMDWDLLGVVNPILDGATGIRLQDGASCDILLPFDLYRYRFTSSEWNGLEQSSIWLQVTNYPTRKIIQVNIGEE